MDILDTMTFYAEKLSLKILKNAKTASHNITYQFMVYSWSTEMVRFTQVSKMLKKLHFKV